MKKTETVNAANDAGVELGAHILGVAMRTPGCRSFADFKMGIKLEESPDAFVNSLGVSAMAARERRRAPISVLLSLDVAAQACEDAGASASDLVGVFASGVGDADTMNQLYQTVCSNDKQVSPTVFHNSVHNAASGYWTIGNQCQQAVSFISADEYSFSMALLEAVVLANAQPCPVLLVVSDVASPEQLSHLHRVSDTFAMALVLSGSNANNSTQRSDTKQPQQHLSVKIIDRTSPWPTMTADVGFESHANLYESNAAARGLSLLQLINESHKSVDLSLPISEYASLQLS